ncbi:hypothetical protein [Clostridium tyrobutyricum]|uniref:hypothetical protein n=1 Tax=Clostridium tyrobutyricum TaxID=1519 RepID=UPI00057EAC69|nr:hypothetical protein [Clostridium tyrobutyricum]
MISSYPDYFAPMPMMPRGIPTIPGYSIGNIESPITRMEEDSDQADYESDNFENEDTEENNINESKNSDNTQQDENPENISESKDNIDINIDKGLTRQQTGATGPAATGPTGPPPFEMAPGSPVEQDINYTQGYLRTQIGKRVRVTFLLGTGTLQDRTGILTNVGISYIIIRNEETNTRELADIYSIKFVSIFD